MKATNDKETILTQFEDGPDQLENALKGMNESDLDYAPSGGGWSVREIVHHLADGDDIWKFCIKMALGNEQAEFHLEWYWAFPQTYWASNWAYTHRAIGTSLDLLRINRKHILDLLAQRPEGWDCSADLREPDGKIISVSVGFVVEMQANHVFHHIKRIQAIRKELGV